MYFHSVVGIGSYTTSTTNMYNKDFTHQVLSGQQPSKDIVRVHKFQQHQRHVEIEIGQQDCDRSFFAPCLAFFLPNLFRQDWTSMADDDLVGKDRRKNVSLDPTRHCMYTSNTKITRQVRITSTVNVIQACIFRVWPVLEVTQRVPPTCTKTDFTYLVSRTLKKGEHGS